MPMYNRTKRSKKYVSFIILASGIMQQSNNGITDECFLLVNKSYWTAYALLNMLL
jgi:hypothetical protein